jgi:hypothetical protein
MSAIDPYHPDFDDPTSADARRDDHNPRTRGTTVDTAATRKDPTT